MPEDSDESKMGDGHNNEVGLYLQEMLRLVVTLLEDSDQYDINVITDDKQKIRYTPDKEGVIIIFLKDHHYTVGYYIRDQGYIGYFNSYGTTTKEDEERRLRDLE